MSNRTVVAGYGIHSQYALNSDELINGLLQGKLAQATPYFKSETDLELVRLDKNFRLETNPGYLPFPAGKEKKLHPSGIESITIRLEDVIDQALSKAGLDRTSLQGKNVRVYLVGSGMRSNMADAAGYMLRNDEEDLLISPSIKELSSKNYAQDRLANQLSQRYALAYPPASLYSASCSSMAALHIANNMITHDLADLCLVVGWTDTLLQDILFLSSQNILSVGKAQPFSMKEGGVLPSNVAVAMLLESEQHAIARGASTQQIIHSTAAHQSSGGRGSSSFSADFRSIASIMEGSLGLANLTAEDIACIFPHANGLYSSDKAESLAILKIWGDRGIPVVSYKGQLGYTSSCSALVDLIIAADALEQSRLIAFTTNENLDSALQLDLHADSPPIPLKSNHIMKVTIGMEGSAIACIFSHYA